MMDNAEYIEKRRDQNQPNSQNGVRLSALAIPFGDKN